MGIITITAAAREAGVPQGTLWGRVKRLGLKPVDGRRYKRKELLEAAALRGMPGNPTRVDEAADRAAGVISMGEAVRLTGVNRVTILDRLKRAGIKPVSRGRYDREATLGIASMPLSVGGKTREPSVSGLRMDGAITVGNAAREAGTTYDVLWHRVKRLGLKPVDGRKYSRAEIMPLAAMRFGRGSVIQTKPVAPGLATISEIARAAGIGAATLRYRLRLRGIAPAEKRPVHGDLYRRADAMPLAREPLQKGRPKDGYKLPRKQDHIRENCSRCGRHDYGNEVRRGLCFDCFCHDFCKERGI